MIVAVVVLLVGSVAASFVDRLGAPTLLLFLGLGMLLGEDGPGGIQFNNSGLARDVGLLALAVILLEGGMMADLPDVRKASPPALMLATVGVAVTAGVTGLVTKLVSSVGWVSALLVGATVSSTDAAAVFSAIRGLNIRRRLAAILEAESGLNDPVAALLVIGLVDYKTTSGYGLGDAAILLVKEMGIGAVGGILIGFAVVWLLQNLPLPSAGIAPVVMVSAALAGYVAVSLVDGSGLLAAYLTGLIIGDARIPHSAVIRGFLQGGAWLAQLGLFVLLGLLVTPHDLVHQGFEPLIIAIALVFVARPLAVLISTSPFRLPLRDQGFLAWAGLRGGVPIVFATFPIAAGVQGSERLFDVVFYVVFVSVVLQGLSVRWAARKLDVIDTRAAPRLAELDTATLQSLGADLLEAHPDDLGIAPGSTLAAISLPGAAVVVAIERDLEILLPRGSTAVQPGDRLFLLVESARLREVRDRLQRVADEKP